MELKGSQRRYLRSLGHHLKPVVIAGKGGMTKGFISQTDRALEDHELIKIRFGPGFEEDIVEAAALLVSETGSALAGTIGKTALLYRPRKDDPEIILP